MVPMQCHRRRCTTSTAGAWGTIDIDDGGWHHVMGTYDGAEVVLYIDGLEDLGNQEATTVAEGTIDIGNDYLTIGHNLGYLLTDEDDDGIRDGTIDEVQIFEIGVPWRSDQEDTISVVKIYRDLDGHENCGGNYLPGDIDESCYVDIADAKVMAQEWLECSSIDREGCDGFWR